jgi:hypothetical protein
MHGNDGARVRQHALNGGVELAQLARLLVWFRAQR